MSEMVEHQVDESWDLAEVVAERRQPETQVTVFLNEYASHAKSELLKRHSNTTDEDELAKLDTALTEVGEQLEASKYTIHLRGVPARMREDIASKALAKFPVKPSVLGQDDPTNARDRMKFENNLLWFAHVVDVVNPRGRSKTDWTVESLTVFADSLPALAARKVDQAIRELAVASEKFTVESQNVDF